MMLIDTTNPLLVQEFNERKEMLDYEQRKKEFYDENDFVLVRTTNFLNSNHTFNPISKVPFVVRINGIAYSAIYDILKDKYNINVYVENDDYKKFREMLEKYSPLSTQFRSTVHFTLNGLVSSHSKGSFDDKNFIVIDKLKNHLGIDDFRSIRMEDTYLYGTVPISNEAIILINESKYQELIDKFPYLDTYNVVLFRGDERLATEMLLVSMNIVPEKIEEHSAEYSSRSQLHKKFFDLVTEKYNVDTIPHSYSSEYKEDDQKNLILWQIYDIKFYNELFDYFAIEEEKKESLINFLTSNEYDMYEKTEALKKFIISVGLEKYQEFVLNYNQKIYDAISEGIYPTNEEILLSGSIELNNSKKLL